MTAPRLREQRRPPSSSDRRPPRRGGGSSPYTYAASAAGRPADPARPRVARHSLVGSARALATAACLSLMGTLALPTTAQAQSVTSLVSNIGQGSTLTLEFSNRGAQRFTTGPHATGYTLSSVDVVSADAEGTSFEAKVCTVDGDGHPTSTCTDLAGPASFAAGTIAFTAPANTVLAPATTYTVVLRPDIAADPIVTYGVTTADGEDAGQADGWSIADTYETWATSFDPPDWVTSGSGRSFRIAIKGRAVVIPPGLDVTLHLSNDAVLEDATPITVTATASPASPVPFTVEISASPVAPVTDDDLELSTNRTLSFAAGATGSTGTVTIRPVDDDEPEPPGVVTISGVVSNPAIPNPDDVTLTIHNNDKEFFEVAIDAPAAVDEGAGTATVTYTLTKRDGAPVANTDVIFYHGDAETATRGVDYTPPVGDLSGGGLVVLELSLPPSAFSNTAGTVWVAEGSFEIGIVDDAESEPDETIVFTVEAGKGESPRQTIVIRDDDRPAAVSIAAANPTGLEGQPAVFTLSRTGATGSALTVTVALTEQADRDVLPDGAATERTVTFARGASTAALAVELKDDELTEPDRDLTAAVQAGAGYTVGDPSTATVTVEDDDAPTPPVIEDIDVVSTPRLRWRNSREEDTYGEGENIRFEARFDQTVHVEGYPVLALEVGDPCISVCEARYESGDGTDTLVFAYLVLDVDIDRNGVAIPANPIGESIDEFDGFSIRNDWDQEARLSYRREGTKSGHRVDGTRQAAQHLSVEDAEAHEDDGEMTFTVRLEPRGLGIVTVDYRTRDGSGDTGAKAGEDYTETRGTLRFNPLETERTVSVPITDDAHEDDGETFTLRLSNPDGARLRDGDRAAKGTIRNSDPEALSASFPTSAFASASHSGADDRPQAVVAFSEAVAAFAADTPSVSVTGGTVASVQPHAEDGLENAWVFFLVPDGGGDVTFALVADAACAAGGICTAGGKALTEVPAAAAIPGPGGPEEPEGPPLSASFEGVPSEHDGESAFTFRAAFSEALSMMNGRRLREDVVAVSGGRATSASRVDRRRDLWELTVEPDSRADVTVTVAAGAACGTPAAVCTKDGRALSNTISATVRGPVGISVADARVEEGAGAVLDFTVSLDRAGSSTVTVDYSTSDGTATAGQDYTATSGTLRFAAGESSKTVAVAVIDDSHDEGEETLTLRLSNPSGGRLAEAEATGTIENRDPLPRAFMARFGRTAAVHVVEQVQERIEARREVGFEARFAGRQLRPGMVREMAVEFLNRLAPSVGPNRVGAGVHHPMSGSPAADPGAFGTAGPAGGAPMGTADVLGGGANPMEGMPGTADGQNPHGHYGMGFGGGTMQTGSAFVMNHQTRRGGILSFWSRGAQSQFAGREGDLSLDGRVRTTMFGADYARGSLLTGLSLSHSRGRGGYSGADIGEVTSSVTGLYPWLGYKVTERVTLWGVTGYGKGALTLTPGEGAALRSGLSMALAAGGMRGELADSVIGGFGLAFKADALWVGTGIEGVDGPEGRLAATDAVVTRYRAVLEASRGYRFERGLSLKPSLEVGLRRDGGDAETGAGVDLGGGLIVSDALTGLSADVRVRMLLVHQDQGFRDRGVSISFSYDPAPLTPLGFLAKLTPSWGGQAESGAQALWGQETMAGMADGGPSSGGHLGAELGYGMAVGGRLVGMPSFGIGASDDGRDYKLGYGLTVSQDGATHFELGVYANRRESLGQGGAEHGVLGRLTASW